MKTPASLKRDPRVDNVRLRHGRWYSLTLRDGTVLPMMAWSDDPGHVEWQLIGDHPTTLLHDVPPHLLVQPDGSFVRDGGYCPEDHYGDVKAVAEGLTVLDLVPADALARSLWRKLIGPYQICPRRGGMDWAYHHPLCHTADGVPLFVTYGPQAWREHVRDEFTEAYEGGILEI